MQPVVPEEVGFSPSRLQRIATVLQAAIDHGDIAGAVTLIARQGKVVHCAAVRLRVIAARAPMRPAVSPMIALLSPVWTGSQW